LTSGTIASSSWRSSAAAHDCRDDLAENGIDDILGVTAIEMRVQLADELGEIGFDHAGAPYGRWPGMLVGQARERRPIWMLS
jgi:hypothetical protein